jgi:hypothetical protein
MEFLIDTAELQRIAGLLSVAAKMNTDDPSGRIYINAKEDNSVLFLANNGETGISVVSTKATVKESDSVVISYGKTKSFITSFTPWNETYGAKEFCFKSTEAGMFITVVNVNEDGKKSKGRLKLDTYDVHSVRRPEPFKKADFILNSSIFKAALNKVLYAIDPHDSRSFIRGMNVRFDNDYIYFAGTNGTKLSEYKIKNISELKKGSFIFRHDFIMGLRRALGDETQIFFEIEKGKIKVSFDDVYFWGNLIIGENYPDYSDNLVDFTDVIRLNKDVLMNILIPSKDVFNPDDYHRITFHIDDKKLKIYNDYASFEYEGEIECPREFIIDVSGASMLDTISAIKDDVLLLKFSNDMGCLIFDSGNFEDQKALITPIKRR